MTIVENGSEIEVTLNNGITTVIDSVDRWILNEFPTWSYRGRYISCARSLPTEYGKVRQAIYLQRLVVRPPQMYQVDHVDRNRLNNRRSNLRICTNGQNAANTAGSRNRNSKYKGVCFDVRPLKKPWCAFISGKQAKAKGIKRNQGRYATEEEAARAYDAMAIQAFGEFAYLNFPDERSA